MGLGDLPKWFQLKPEQLFAVTVVSGLLLFLPDTWVQRMGLLGLVNQFRPVIGFVFAISAALVASQGLFAASRKIIDFYSWQQLVRSRKQALQKLTSDERRLIRQYLDKETKSLFLPFDGLVSGLCSKEVLFRSSVFGREGWSDVPAFWFNLSDWAWDYLAKNSELVATQADDRN